MEQLPRGKLPRSAERGQLPPWPGLPGCVRAPARTEATTGRPGAQERERGPLANGQGAAAARASLPQEEVLRVVRSIRASREF